MFLFFLGNDTVLQIAHIALQYHMYAPRIPITATITAQLPTIKSDPKPTKPKAL